MTAPQTPERIQAIREREQAATKGPWRIVGPCDYVYAEDLFGHGQMYVLQPRGWGHLTGTGACHFNEHKAVEIQHANAEFAAHAREDIPYLLAQLSAQQERIAALERERDEARKVCADVTLECAGKLAFVLSHDVPATERAAKAVLVTRLEQAEATLARVRALISDKREHARKQREFAESKDCVVPVTLRGQADANEEFADDLDHALVGEAGD